MLEKNSKMLVILTLLMKLLKQAGGDLGWFGPGAMDPDFEELHMLLKS